MGRDRAFHTGQPIRRLPILSAAMVALAWMTPHAGAQDAGAASSVVTTPVESVWIRPAPGFRPFPLSPRPGGVAATAPAGTLRAPLAAYYATPRHVIVMQVAPPRRQPGPDANPIYLGDPQMLRSRVYPLRPTLTPPGWR